MLLSEILKDIIKNNININLIPIINNYKRNTYVLYSNIDITDGDTKNYIYSDIYLNNNNEYNVKICIFKNLNKDPKYRHGLRLIENNIDPDIEYTFSKKLTLREKRTNKKFKDIELSSNYTYNIDNWNIPIIN
jgi:hypothetical protein